MQSRAAPISRVLVLASLCITLVACEQRLPLSDTATLDAAADSVIIVDSPFERRDGTERDGSERDGAVSDVMAATRRARTLWTTRVSIEAPFASEIPSINELQQSLIVVTSDGNAVAFAPRISANAGSLTSIGPTGIVRWRRSIGGEPVIAMSADASGGIYIARNRRDFYSSATRRHRFAIELTRIQSTGMTAWERIYDRSQHAAVLDLAATTEGVVIGGVVSSAVQLGTSTPEVLDSLTIASSNGDAFLALINPNGQTVWAHSYGREFGSELLTSLAACNAQSILSVGMLGGSEPSQISLGGAPLQTGTVSQISSLFAASYGHDGNHRWSTTTFTDAQYPNVYPLGVASNSSGTSVVIGVSDANRTVTIGRAEIPTGVFMVGIDCEGNQRWLRRAATTDSVSFFQGQRHALGTSRRSELFCVSGYFAEHLNADTLSRCFDARGNPAFSVENTFALAPDTEQSAYVMWGMAESVPNVSYPVFSYTISRVAAE